MQQYGNVSPRLAKQFIKRDRLFDDLKAYLFGIEYLKGIVEDIKIVHQAEHYVFISLNEDSFQRGMSLIKELIVKKAKTAKFLLSSVNGGLKFSILTENINTFPSDKVFEVRSKSAVLIKQDNDLVTKNTLPVGINEFNEEYEEIVITATRNLRKVNSENKEPSAQAAEVKEQATKSNSKPNLNQNKVMTLKKAKNVKQMHGQILKALISSEFNTKDHYVSVVPNKEKGKNTINCKSAEAASKIKSRLEEIFGGMYELSLKEGKKSVIVLLGEVEQKPATKKAAPKKVAKKSAPKKIAKKAAPKKVAKKSAPKKATKKSEVTLDTVIADLKSFSVNLPRIISVLEGLKKKDEAFNKMAKVFQK